MKLTRIRKAHALPGFRLRLELTDGSVIERAVRRWMSGPMFADIREDSKKFASVAVEHGTVVWPNGADLCPDLLIWEGPPPFLKSNKVGTRRTRTRTAGGQTRETTRR